MRRRRIPPIAARRLPAGTEFFTIGRATYALGGSDYVGAIFTDTEHAGRHNRVVGSDLAIKFAPPQQFSATFLASQTGIGSSGDTHGTASQVSYNYNTRRFTWENQIEHYDRDFQMDTAFYNRTGFTAAWSFGDVSFYPKQDFWIQRVHPFVFVKRGHDEVQNGDEDFVNTGIRFHFTRQGFLNVSHGQGHEPWVGQRFETGRIIDLNGSVQLLRWLQISAFFNKSGVRFTTIRSIRFRGDRNRLASSTTLQPNQHFSQDIDVDTVRFDREVDTASGSSTSTSSISRPPTSSTSIFSSGCSSSSTARVIVFSPTCWHRTSSSRARCSTPVTARCTRSARTSLSCSDRQQRRALRGGQPRDLPQGVLPASVLRRLGLRLRAHGSGLRFETLNSEI